MSNWPASKDQPFFVNISIKAGPMSGKETSRLSDSLLSTRSIMPTYLIRELLEAYVVSDAERMRAIRERIDAGMNMHVDSFDVDTDRP